jgi:hypothetical protein
MSRSRTVLVCLLVSAMNVFAQDSTAPPKAPSAKEKEQALAALTEARSVIFPLRRKREARQLFARIAPLVAAAGDAAVAQEILTLLPANEREEIQPQIVAAQVDSGQVAAALETAAAISSDDAKAGALLLIVEGQAKSGEFVGAMRTAGLIPAEQVESAQALVEVAEQEKAAGKHDEAIQLLRRAATAAASLANSNGGAPDCGLSVLAQIGNAQESMGESAEAVKTLQLAEGRVQEADSGCKLGATQFLQDNSEGKPEALKTEIAGLRERLDSSPESTMNEELNGEDSSNVVETVTVGDPAPEFQLQQPAQNQPPSLTPEQVQAALDSVRRVKPLYLRARAAMSASRVMLEAERTDEAEEAIRIGLEAADTVQDQNLREMMLQSKAHALAAAKDWEGARAVVEEIADGPQRTAALVDIAFSATEDGHAQLALSWATAEGSPLSEASVLMSIARALLHQQQQQTYFIR